jgi:hypothetical protein
MIAQALFLRTVGMAMQGIKQEIKPKKRQMSQPKNHSGSSESPSERSSAMLLFDWIINKL